MGGELYSILEYLRTRYNRSQEVTISQLEGLGYRVKRLRVKWSGGVGTYKTMRGGKIRIQVGASQVYCKNGKFYGFQYAPCIEIGAT